MKILFVIDNLGSGGAQNQLSILASELQKRGNEVKVFTYYPQSFFKSRLTEAGVEILQELKKDKLGWNVVNALKKILAKEAPDALISFLETPNFYACLARFLSKQKIKTIISYRSKSDLTNMSWVHKMIKEWVNKQADVIVANSIHEKERWQQAYPKNAAKWQTVYNAVFSNGIALSKKQSSDSFLVVGSISPAKNGLLIIEALNILKQKGIRIPLTWIGQKVLHIPERKNYLDRMEQKIQEYDLEEQWIWKEPTDKIFEEYLSHKALILASKIEGLPNVVCEALYCGLPCIVSNVLDHPHLIQDQETGMLFDPEHPTDLSEAILKIENLSDQEFDAMSQKAKAAGQKMFNLDVFINEYQKILSN